MRNFFFLFIFGLSLTASARAGELSCPSRLVTDQKIKPTPKGWAVGKSPFSPVLSGVGIYDGPPEDMADLVPDNVESDDTFSEWTLDANNKRAYWLECRYAYTNLTLSQALPKGIKNCRVTYDKTVRVSGDWLIKSIQCK